MGRAEASFHAPLASGRADESSATRYLRVQWLAIETPGMMPIVSIGSAYDPALSLRIGDRGYVE